MKGGQGSLKKFLFVLSGTLLLDQVSKLVVLRLMQPGQSIPLLTDFVRLTFVRNSGVVFGLLSGHRTPLILTTFLTILVLLFLIFRSRRSRPGMSFSLVLVLAGAIGNLIDRLRLGGVVDFIDVGWKSVRWPVFNVADTAVTVGVLLFLYHSLLTWHPAE
ncbi:MAG: signal peptidase II [Candidatus Eisenbacteria bacterium]|nr:signal peptidase II [Candidatus Eisenbacteria bacterium]